VLAASFVAVLIAAVCRQCCCFQP